MNRFRIVLGLAAVAGLAFWLPALLQRPAPRAGAGETPNATAEAPEALEAPAAKAVDGPAGEPALKAPVVQPGVTGAAKTAAQALVDKMLGRQTQISAWAEAERRRIKELEVALQQAEQRIKDADVRGDEMSQRLERMRSESSANSAEYEALRTSYNDLVVERNRLVRKYEQEFGEYSLAVRDFDAKIADYDSRMRSGLPVPPAHR